MDNEEKAFLYGVWITFGTGTIILALAITSLAITYENIACPIRAEAQNLKGDFGIIQGCVFTLPDGKKVNEKNYRVL
jgi:hypothetical protein